MNLLFIKPSMMGCMEIKRLVYLLVETNPFSSRIQHKISAMIFIIKLISYNTPIDDVEANLPYFYVFICWSLSMLEEVRNITTQPILSLAGDTDSILIG